MELAEKLFAALRECGFDGRGITRDSYGAGEQRAHELMAAEARRLGLTVQRDAALNLYITYPGSDPTAPVVMTGSHLDSVPCGGNFDGAAGVVAGMAILSAWARARVRPRHAVCVVGIRAEESAWFPVSYVGSKAAFGILESSALQSRRVDTGATLAEHIGRLGGEPQKAVAGEGYLQPERIDSFTELHIEQGPVLLGDGVPLGVVSGICGSLRYREAQVLGRYAHSGATPRLFRQDAVVAFSGLVARLQQRWAEMEAHGHELTLTLGKVNTDTVQADFSKVCGQVRFCIDIRSRHPETLQQMDREIHAAIRELEAEYGVSFMLGEQSGSQPAVMDPALQETLGDAAAALKTPYRIMPSGAGHDAAVFANRGIPTAMLFVRNANGSHNPEEALNMNDFRDAVGVLGRMLAQRAGAVAEKEMA
ncbi:hydantoinase/carbamoylase family amidase [Brenneria sp. 4F2]|nr:hydantoinase/carbamoylase family amidase [Brenneria bubanii]